MSVRFSNNNLTYEIQVDMMKNHSDLVRLSIY